MNKIIVSIILAIVLVLVINKISNVIYFVEKPEKSAYQVANVASSSTSEKTTVDSEPGDIMALLATASFEEGEKIFKKCTACHSIAKDGKNKIGPALWGVLGRQAGSVPDYKYSKAMAAYGKAWSFQEMDGFLLKPKDWIKGTKMSFAGLKNAKERASVIVYMNKKTDNPLPSN